MENFAPAVRYRIGRIDKTSAADAGKRGAVRAARLVQASRAAAVAHFVKRRIGVGKGGKQEQQQDKVFHFQAAYVIP